MLSHFDQGPFAPCPAPFNMAEHVLAAGLATPDKIALSVVHPARSERWSHARLRAAVLGVGTGLLDSGLRPGQIVLMRLGNTPDFPIAYLGAIAAGLVPVPTSALLTEPEVAAIVDTLSPAAILRAPDVACPDTDIPVYDTKTLRAWHACPPATFHRGDPDRLGYIIFTSGTSGHPQAVMHAHRAIWARQMMMTGWYDLRSEDRLMHAGAFNWTYTLGTGLMDPWTMGATALIPAPGVSHDQIGLLLKRHDATIFAAAPGVYRNVLKAPLPALPHLRHGLSAGEKMPGPIRDQWTQTTGTQVFEAFGMSECSTFISGSPATPPAPGAMGAPQVGRRIALIGQDGPVPVGDVGQIAVHRSDPGLMLGYYNAPEATADRFQGDWFLTGDLARMDAAYQMTYQGRADDMMNAGGYRVSPLEVEAALAHLTGIHDIAVAEVEVKDGVHVIGAFYTGPEAIDEDTLKAAASAKLARYKQPRLYRHVDALPRNPNGKLRRRALHKLL